MAGLARLDLTDEEVEVLAGELEGILAHVSALGTEGTDGTEDSGGRTSGIDRAPLRTDEPDDRGGRADVTAFTPEHDGGLVLVPRLSSHGGSEGSGGAGSGDGGR